MRSRKRTKTLPILVVIFGLLLIVTWFVKPPDGDGGASARPLLSIAPDEFQRITISAAERPAIRLEQTSDGWYVEAPVQDRADPRMVSAMIDIVSSVAGRPFRDVEPDEFLRYGLSPHQGLLLEIRDARGNSESLLLGDVVPLDVGYVYALNPATGDVYLVYRQVRSFLEQDVLRLRDRSILRTDPDRIDTIEILTSADREPVLLSRQGPWWEIIKPAPRPGDLAAVSELIGGLSGLQAAGFLDHEPTPGGTVFTVIIRTIDGSAETITLNPGRDDDEPLVPVSRRGRWYSVAEASIRQLPLTIDSLTAQTALRFLPRNVASIRVRHGESIIELEERPDGWWLTVPIEQKAADQTVRFALGRLSSEPVLHIDRGDNILHDPRGQPDVTVEITEHDGAHHRLHLFDTHQPELLIGTSTFRDTPFLVDPAFLADVPVAAGAYADQRLIPFESGNVRTMEIDSDSGSVRLERRDGQWQIVSPRRARADQPIAWSVVFRLEAARYSAVVTPVDGITDINYGPAVARVTLWDELKQPIGTVEFFADVQTGHTYAKTSAHIGLLKVDDELLPSLPTQYDQLVYRR